MMKYDIGKGKLKNWIVADSSFSSSLLGKAEAIMSLGNGYMGLRSATEEPYVGEVRNLFVAGTFNKSNSLEVSELPNAADVTRLDIRVDGERLDVTPSRTANYVRTLNLKVAELTRSFIWLTSSGKEVAFTFKRFVSLDNLHLIAMNMEIESLNADVEIYVESGVNAQVTNSGVQHFYEGEKRIYDKKYIELLQKTVESDIDFMFHTVHRASLDGVTLEDPFMRIDRRMVMLTYKCTVTKGQKLSLQKLTTVHTSRDKEFAGMELQAMCEQALSSLKVSETKGYDALLHEHALAWEQKVWGLYTLDIDSKHDFDLLAARFALYHLTVMTPAHDERMGIAAKGLSGEGYQGHSFWDTEMFILPFFIYSNPKVARSLLTYRYLGLEGARKKAQSNGYEGAMYPWEAAWPSEGEVAQEWGRVDIVTGKQTKIWTGFIEQHITADIAFAVRQYYMVTGDQAFMDDHGYEIIFDTARFWVDRLEWDESKQHYGINDVIGPDEYKEHVDNNAFTNYFAHENIQLAITYYQQLKEQNTDVFNRLNEKLQLDEVYIAWNEAIGKLYLPQPREEDLVIPQDDMYLMKRIIDLTKYKNQTHVNTIFEDYSLEQLSDIQVSKQADLMILFYLLEDKFSQEVKIANYNYYEPKTIHDSSLSLSTHAILANDLNDTSLAYRLYRQACEIDLGPEMKSSDLGVHTASMGGIWQIIVMGFGGMRMMHGTLRMNPKLPLHWNKLEFAINWQGQRLEVIVTKNELVIKAVNQMPVTIEVYETEYSFDQVLTVSLNEGGQ
ncbi:glycoside hydrolase family 65 protein [Paenibacillus sp. IHBB 10380]|uniref:glycoside hydrolase family 65 protein n=1 Tax=Paenibacillus sp. IHBB 10380 TaxID=1566358 RepID=UPI0005CFD308|nr:glycosyl hydrolase family 65 protein [Paenibacillus sp. IHBB 10380]AJS58101.1 trehalase [Paenibacillus sp. IHBB 10380]